MKKVLFYVFVLIFPLMISACAENFSNGERIGFVTKVSRKGAIWKSWEITLNTTQTGMNTASTEHLSIDNDREEVYTNMIATLDSCARYGWKVRIVYHEVWGCKNFCKNRGDEPRFVNEVQVLDRNPMDNILGGNKTLNSPVHTGDEPKGKDTMVVIIKDLDKLIEATKNKPNN